MPRKQHFNLAQATSHKYVHPSLESSAYSASTHRVNSNTCTTRSVNEYIEHLRREQSRGVRKTALASTEQGDGLADSRHAPRLQNRPIAGPPPPRSWMVSTTDQSDLVDETHRSTGNLQRLGHLPGTVFPEPSSLAYQCLKSMACRFDWHSSFDRCYLSALPIEMREQLLSFIATFGPPRSVSIESLEVCFPLSPGPETALGQIHRLDLSYAVGHPLPLERLDKFWTLKSKPAGTDEDAQTLPESWDEDAEVEKTFPSSLPLRFSHITHLSLSHPHAGVSWGQLLRFSRHLGTVTHLSLAYWPRPQLQKTDLGFSTRTDTGSGVMDAVEEAAGILRLLSRNTPSIEWISFEGCHAWLSALCPSELPSTMAHNTNNGAAPGAGGLRARRAGRGVRFEDPEVAGSGQSWGRGPEWTTSWRGVNCVNLSQGWVPGELPTTAVKALYGARSRLANFPELLQERTGLAALEGAYRVIAPTAEIERAMQRRDAMRKWYMYECEALKLGEQIRASKASRTRQARCHIEYGWGRQELLDAGYNQTIVDEIIEA